MELNRASLQILGIGYRGSGARCADATGTKGVVCNALQTCEYKRAGRELHLSRSTSLMRSRADIDQE